MSDPRSASPHTGHRERLRTRYAASGGEGFFEHEYLELLLTYAIPRKDTNALAHTLLDRFGSLHQVMCADMEQLAQVEGVGESTALFLTLQKDLAKRLQLSALADSNGRIKLGTPLSAAQYACARLQYSPYETVLVACLNARCELLHSETLQKGSLVEAPIYPRNIAEIALLRRAHSIVLMHNHPSGNPAPSGADADATEAVKSALSGIGVRLSDHLIVGGTSVYSFAAGVVLDLSGEEPRLCTLAEFSAGDDSAPRPLLRVMEPYHEPQ